MKENEISSFSSELLSEIFENLQIPELFKCILVNKKWSANAVRILWRNPIEFINLNLKLSKDKSYLNIISTMIKCLPIEVKINIRTHGINFDELKEESQPIYDYCSLIKKVPFDIILNAINILFNSLVEKSIIKGKNYLFIKRSNINILNININSFIKIKHVIISYFKKSVIFWLINAFLIIEIRKLIQNSF
jgi:hypothetical protein